METIGNYHINMDHPNFYFAVSPIGLVCVYTNGFYFTVTVDSLKISEGIISL